MSIIDEGEGEADAAPQDGSPLAASSTEKPAIKMRNKRGKRVENGKLRPTSIHIFEDLEKNGVIPDQALSSYKSLARNQRMSRTMQALYSIDPHVAKDMFKSQGAASSANGSQRPMSMFDFRSRSNPTTPCASSPATGNDSSALFLVAAMEEWSPEQTAFASTAALTIQRHFRGFLGRRRYAARMWEVYAEEEDYQRTEKEKVLVEETEILVEARKALIDMEELETVKRNAERLLVSRVVTIQRAWRSHRAGLVRDLPLLAESRLDEKGMKKQFLALAPPPSSISCDSIAEQAMKPRGETAATSSSSAMAAATKASGFDREAIRLQLASDDDVDDLDVRIVDPSSSSSRRRRFSDDGFLEVTLNDILEEAEAETASVLCAFPSNAQGAGSAATEATDKAVLIPDETLADDSDASRCAAVDEPLPLPKNAFNDVCDRLRKETEIQLAQTPALAQLQMELERNEKEESPSVVDSFEQLKDVVRQSGIDEAEISNLNVASLQVLVNDLLNRVETNNEELMALLQERDQLHMEQDSMLVDIEDLIKQCKRQAELNSRRPVQR